ncbi:MAG: hypothetical protein V3R84_08860 [Acidimicrobiia bacterium]
MPKFLLAFHGGGDPPETQEASAKLIAAWGSWLQGLGDSLIDPGNPSVAAKTVTSDGVAEGGGPNPVSGYSLLRAADVHAAISATAGCPIFDAGGHIEIVQLEEM